ncbi:PriCT-2 domain-containing protein [Ralstonia solanacearum]|uniref:PriCT-2 domain-containing protein n=1 Tax=Ralstonia solanacearum TaxID=305 RepID=UPI003CC53CB8
MNQAVTTQGALRMFSVMRYANETDNVGRQNVGGWSQVESLLGKREIRVQKTGKAFAPVKLKPGATRARSNVEAISMAVADIDTEGTKDKATGRLQSVTKRAPDLAQLRGSINRYAWIAHSSHGHDPQRLGGVIKYRIVFPLSRDCTPEEWSDVWHGLNTLLGGHCDGACKDVARLYYLPSSPPDTAHEAFFVSNEGEYLDPDYLISLGRQSAAVFPVGNLSNAPGLPAPMETPDEVARVRSMLRAISADCDRETWRNVIWSLAATGWACAERIAREWSQSAPDRFVDGEFGKVWKTFDPKGGIGFGSLTHYAKKAGWVDAASVSSVNTASADATGDIKNGQIFAHMFRDKLLFVHETNSVLLFDQGAGWVQARPHEEDRAGKQVIAALRAVAAEQWKQAPDDPKTKRLMAHVERSSAARNLQAMINMAKSEPGMTVQMFELDADPMLLGVTNGVLDLRTSC